MSDLISAAKQALEALETSGDSYPALERKAIKSLRQAIATEESSATQEPVCYRVRWPKIGGGYSWVMSDVPLMEEHGFVNEALYAHPQPAQPKAEQDGHDDLTIAYMSGLHRGKELAAQPKREPLTDEQQIAESLRKKGLTLVKTAKGYDVMKLGEITAHGIGKGES